MPKTKAKPVIEPSVSTRALFEEILEALESVDGYCLDNSLERKLAAGAVVKRLLKNAPETFDTRSQLNQCELEDFNDGCYID